MFILRYVADCEIAHLSVLLPNNPRFCSMSTGSTESQYVKDTGRRSSDGSRGGATGSVMVCLVSPLP